MSDVGTTISSLPRAAILHAADSSRLQRLVQQHGKRVGAARFVAGETLDECVAVLRQLNDAGLHANTTLLGEAIARRRGRRRGHRRVRADPRAARRGGAPGERRAQADAPRAHPRRGDRLRQRRAPRREGRRARHVRPHRHGAVGVRRRDAAHLRAPPRRRARQRRNRAPVVPLSHARTTSSACCRAGRTSGSSRARIWSPRPSRTRRRATSIASISSSSSAACAEGAYIAVATHDEAIIRKVQAFASREGVRRDRFEFQMLYGVRPGAAALDRGRGLQGARGDALRPGLVPVPHAPPRRASREPGVLPEEPRPAMTSPPASAEVVVVGGGVIGTSIAFHLAEAGVDVCLLERDELARGSTSRAAGGIRAQFSDPLNIAIGLRSIEAFTRFGERPGAEIDLHQVGYLFLLDRDEDVASVRGERGAPERARRPEPVRRSRRGRGAVSPRGARRRPRGDVLPARRAREPGGRRPGLRGGRSSARRLRRSPGARCRRS